MTIIFHRALPVVPAIFCALETTTTFTNSTQHVRSSLVPCCTARTLINATALFITALNYITYTYIYLPINSKYMYRPNSVFFVICEINCRDMKTYV